MANREKGEATFQVGEKTYTMRIDMHAWALAQDALTTGERVPDLELILKRLYAGHALSMIAACWAALQRFHPEVGNLMDTSALMERSKGAAAKALLKAVNSSSPDAKDLEELGVTANPPKAQDDTAQPSGTGEKSASVPAVPV